jgi:cbb3-type cytochrome oxidase subunit 3
MNKRSTFKLLVVILSIPFILFLVDMVFFAYTGTMLTPQAKTSNQEATKACIIALSFFSSGPCFCVWMELP